MADVCNGQVEGGYLDKVLKSGYSLKSASSGYLFPPVGEIATRSCATTSVLKRCLLQGTTQVCYATEVGCAAPRSVLFTAKPIETSMCYWQWQVPQAPRTRVAILETRVSHPITRVSLLCTHISSPHAHTSITVRMLHPRYAHFSARRTSSSLLAASRAPVTGGACADVAAGLCGDGIRGVLWYLGKLLSAYTLATDAVP
eukprot:2470049-Rhodomonas_salina.2